MSDGFRPTTPEEVEEFLKTPMRNWLCTTKEWKKRGGVGGCGALSQFYCVFPTFVGTEGSTMKTIKVSEATNAQLDWLVASKLGEEAEVPKELM